MNLNLLPAIAAAFFLDAPAAQPARPTRADTAEVYLALERAYRLHPPGELGPEINRAFDAATLRFFSGQGVIEPLREITDRLRFGPDRTPHQAFASSLKVSARPQVLNLSSPEPVVVTVEPLYDAQPVGAVTVRIVGPDGATRFEAATTEPRASFTIDPARFPPGTLRVQVVSGEDPLFTSRLFVTDRSLTEVRQALLRSLEGVPGLEQAVAACRARISLLSDTPNSQESAQFMADLCTLRAEVEREAAAIQGGVDPYRARTGDYWRVFSFGGLEIPARVFAPGAAVSRPSPLLVALHGAGGDENLWLDGYGAGVLKDLAEKHALVIVSPRTELLLGNAPAFDAIIAAMSDLYTVEKVFLIGHSLGAMTSTGLLVQRPDRISAACLFAGTGRFARGAPIPPTLIVSGDLDPLMRAPQVEAGAASAREGGQPVELRMVRGRGHTLFVGEELPSAIDWMLQKAR